MDSEYLDKFLAECLADGLTAVAQQRPEDPIRFLAHWLCKYGTHCKYDKTENKKQVDDDETVKPEGSAEPEAAASDNLNPEQTFPHQGTEEDVQETEQPSSPVLQNLEQEADGQATSELDFSAASAEGDSSPE